VLLTTARHVWVFVSMFLQSQQVYEEQQKQQKAASEAAQ
jgi:hypothetical protein